MTVTCQNPLAARPAARRLLVIRLGAVGDVVRTLPAATRLRAAYPRAHLAWLVEPAAASMLEAQPWIDEVIVFPRDALRESLLHLRSFRFARALVAFVRRLRAARFDLVVDFHAILKSGMLARASGAPLLAGYARPYAREFAWLLVNARARLAPARASRFERNLGLVRFLGVDAAPAAAPLAIPAATAARAAHVLGPGPAPVAIHPGSSAATPHKRYTGEGYAAIARALREREGLHSIVTYGGGEERAFAERIAAASRGAARLAPPTPSLIDLAALFARSRLYVGGDTGPLHVASLVGTPVVQILGPTDALENTPWPGTPWRSVRVPLACSPCRRGCDAATCMRVIPPEAVIAEACALLRETAPGEEAQRATASRSARGARP